MLGPIPVPCNGTGSMGPWNANECTGAEIYGWAEYGEQYVQRVRARGEPGRHVRGQGGKRARGQGGKGALGGQGARGQGGITGHLLVRCGLLEWAAEVWLAPHLASPHRTWPHLTPPGLTSHHLASTGLTPHLTSPHLASPDPCPHFPPT